MTPFIWTSAGSAPCPAQPSAAQPSGYPHKLSYYGGLGGCSWWWCRHLTGSTYLQYSTAVQYNHSTPTGHCAALSAVGELKT